jgi:hypothetical protein
VLLILAEASDPVAAGVARRAAEGGAVLRWLTSDHLATARWDHRIDGQVGGGAETRLRTADGTTTELGEVLGVLNRLRWLPPVPFASVDDRDYGAMERHALVTSALAALEGTVVNPVSPPSLSGPVLSPVAWTALAAASGLPTRRLRLTTDGRRWPARGWEGLDWQTVLDPGVEAVPLHQAVPVGRRPVVWAEPVGPPHHVTVVGPDVLGSPDAAWAERCRRLAEAAGCGLLQVTLAQRAAGEDWVVTGAEPTPTVVPPHAVDLLVALLASGTKVATDGRRTS